MSFEKKRAAAPIFFLLLVFCLSFLSSCNKFSAEAGENGKIIITEVMSSNSAFAPAADGKYYDWVEIYNPTESVVDLSTYYITDNESVPLRCRLSGAIIEPKGYLLVYLSGLDMKEPDGTIHAGFKLSSAGGEKLIISDKHGGLITMLEIPPSESNVSYGLMDGSYVWFSSPTPGSENDGLYSKDISKLEFSDNGVIINEFILKNTFINYDADGDYGDWIELYNPTQEVADLTGYSLSDNPSSPSKWVFPENTMLKPGGYLLIFCDGKDKTDEKGILHTGFSLGEADETLALYTNQGKICSSVDFSFDMPANISCGYPADEDKLMLFARPTPGAANDSPGFELTSSPAPNVNDGILISEVMSVSSKSIQHKSDYIEIYNSTSVPAYLSGYTLARKPGEVVFTFPEITLDADGYLVLYCDGAETSGKELHSEIKINSGGEDFYLADSDGKICDYFSSGKCINGISSGRLGNDVTVRYFFSFPTPGAANTADVYDGYADMPKIERTGGYVESGTAVSISVPDGCEVVYTTDGSIPSEESARYTEPVVIDKTTVLKAVSLKKSCLNSQCVSETFLVEDKHKLPIVSLSSEPSGLFAPQIGILNNYTSDYEREVHIEYFDENGAKCVEFNCGASVFGQYARRYPQKGLKLVLREIYGQNEVTYPFFPESVSGVSTFSSLLLRPCGQDQIQAKLRDELVPAILRGQMDIDYQEFRACALYINGEYWGLYYIKENENPDYLMRKYSFAEDSFDMIKMQYYVQAGSNAEYLALEKFCQTHSLDIKENYDYVCSKVDIDSLINFWIVQTYFSNKDSGNIRCYKAHDGKWRWMLYDFDQAMSRASWNENLINQHLLDPSGHGAADFDNSIIRGLLNNKEFRERFISTYCHHLNTTFAPERTTAILDQMASVIEDEIPRQAERWEHPHQSEWSREIKFIRQVLNDKPALQIQQLRSSLSISEKQMEKYLNENK